MKYLLLTALLGSLTTFAVKAQEDGPKPAPEKEMRTWLGVATEGVHPVLRQHLDLEEGFGVQIAHVPGESPADQAGLKPGDVLSMFDDQKLTTPEHLAILVRSKDKGDTVELTYLRKGSEEKTTVTLGENELPKPDMRRNMPRHGSPDQWKDWHNEMRKHQESFQRRMQDMHRNHRMPDRPRFDDKKGRNDSAPKSRGRSKPPTPEMKNESTVKIDNDDGAVVISQTNGKGRIEIKDAEGKEVYSGPFDTAKGIKGLPEKAQDHLKEMKVDSIDMLAPNPIPVPVPPKRDSDAL